MSLADAYDGPITMQHISSSCHDLQMKESVRLLSQTGRFNLIASEGVEAGIKVLKRFQQVHAVGQHSA